MVMAEDPVEKDRRQAEARGLASSKVGESTLERNRTWMTKF